MAEFTNPSLQQALEQLKAHQDNETLLKASHALVNTKVMCPAKWDKEPSRDASGSMRFEPDTKIQLMVVTNKEGKKFYPFFTNMDQVKAIYNEQSIPCLVLSMDQYVPFLKAGKGQIDGIVVDPAGLNVVFPTPFVEGLYEASQKSAARLNQTMVSKGEKIHLRNLDAQYQDLEAAIISAGFHEKAVNAIYIKERLEDPAQPEKTHWFVLVDSDELDTGIFSRIGKACAPALHGKGMEFMFTNQKLGQDIARSSKPIYTRAQA